MTIGPDALPEEPAVFEGSREERFLALAVETLVHDASPDGDGDIATQLGAYMLDEGQPPGAVPEYVELDDGGIAMSNPPFLLAEIELVEEGLAVAFDSELNLLVDAPVEVTVEGPLQDAVETLEQVLAEIYRTRGRRLEMLDEGVVAVEEIADRR